MVSKRALRDAMLTRRRLLSVAEQESYGRAIQRTFLGLHAFVQAASIALYLPVNGEVPTDEILNQAQFAGKDVYLPVIDGEQIFLRQYTHTDKLKHGRFGILEPCVGCLSADLQKIDIFVVPGVVFDVTGNRGGYGMGYYDRLLQARSNAAMMVGFCYDFQLVDSLEVEPHDIKMDMVITERRVIFSYC